MKTQHLYFRYLSNMDLSIKILFSSDNSTLDILSKDHSLYWLIVNMHCSKTSYLTPCNALHEWFVFLHSAFLAYWVDKIFPTSKCRYVFSISKYSKIKSDSNMTWLFSPVKSTDTNSGILDDNRTHHGKAWLTAVAVVTYLFRGSPFRESAFRESVLSSVF